MASHCEGVTIGFVLLKWSTQEFQNQRAAQAAALDLELGETHGKVGVAGAQRFQYHGEHLRASGCAKQKQHGGRHAARSGLRLPGGFEPIKEKAKQHMSLGRMLCLHLYNDTSYEIE